MKRKFFTLIELLVVIVIIGILITLVAGGIGSMINTAKALKSQNNLKSIGTAIVAFAGSSADGQGHFPVEVARIKADGTVDPAWLASVKADKERITHECMQTLRESKAGSNLDIETYLSPIAPCGVPAADESAADGFAELGEDNVGFLMVKGVAKLSRYRNKAIMRDVDDGHENGAYGYILKSNGVSSQVKAIGPAGKYTTKWFENKAGILNADDFKGDGGVGND